MTDQDRDLRARTIRVLRVVFVLAVLAALVVVGARNAHQLGQVHLKPRPAFLVACAPLTVVAGSLLPLAWRRLLRAIGCVVPLLPAIRVWYLGQASRYVPGGVAAVASRTLLAAREGVPRTLGAASVLVETAMLAAWATLAAGAFLPSSTLATGWRLVLAAAATAGLGLLPWALRLARRVVPRLTALVPDGLATDALYGSSLAYGASTAIKSIAFVLFAAAWLPVRAHDVWLLIGALQAAGVIGLIGITPAGLGVREGVLATLLRHRFTLGSAATVAVAWRAWEFAFELGWLALAGAIGRLRPRGAAVDQG